MSLANLLVINSSNGISQSIIRKICKTNAFKNILCADLYPNYNSIERFCSFQDSLQNSNTKIKDMKISEKTDIYKALKNQSHIVYVTHDYYLNVPPKENLLKTVSNIVKELGQVNKFVLVSPIEHEHYSEEQSNNKEIINEVRNNIPNVVNVKSDLTFGRDSSTINIILNR